MRVQLEIHTRKQITSSREGGQIGTFSRLRIFVWSDMSTHGRPVWPLLYGFAAPLFMDNMVVQNPAAFALPTKYKVNIPCLAVQLHGVFLGTHCMGQITLVVFLFLCYNNHGN